MCKMKVVERDRLVVGGDIPEGCYLTPCLQPIVGDLVWHFYLRKIVEITDTLDPDNITVRTFLREDRYNIKSDLFWVIEPEVD